MFSDCHCHLGEVAEEAVERAERQGFELLLTAGIDIDSSRRAVEAARRYRIVKACVGVHPWYADEYGAEARRLLRDLAGDPEVVAVSEIGLDYVGRMNRDWVYEERIIDRAVQRAAFIGQLRLAEELSLPVLVHDRTPDQEVLEIIEAEGNAEIGAAIHGFSKDPGYAGRCAEGGIHLSIGPRALAAEIPGLDESIVQTPLRWILTETDAAEPEGVLTVAERIAELKGLTRDEVGRAATRNLRRLIGA